MDEKGNTRIHGKTYSGFGCVTTSDEADDISKMKITNKEEINNSYALSAETNNISKEKIADTEGIIQKSSKEQYQHNSQFWMYALPALVALLLLVLMAVDQGTDIFTSFQVCTMDCQCVWRHFISSCEPPASSFIIETPCAEIFGNSQQLQTYCEYAKDETECRELDNWSPIGLRHPSFCLSSVVTILGPSIINSVYLLISMWVLFPSALRYLGLSDTSSFFRGYKILLPVLCILQLLPYTWLAMNFFISIKAWETGYMMLEKETWDITLIKWRFIFSILEDLPHLIIHSSFIVNSIITQDNAGIYFGRNMLYTGSYIGVLSSAASIVLTLTLYKGLPTYKSAFKYFLMTFVSVGIRAGICASYGSAIVQGIGPLAWPLVLAPITAIGLFMLENTLIFICNSLVNFKQSNIVNIILSLRKTDILKQIKNCTNCMISLTFETNSVQGLISSYTYLAFAVALNSGWTSFGHNNYPKSQITFLVFQYLACASLFLNILIVQREGKNKVRCFVYSNVFLMFMGGLYIWIKSDVRSFTFLFFPDIEHLYEFPPNTVELTLSSLTFVFVISGVNAFVNLLVIIYSYYKSLQMNHNIEAKLFIEK